MNPESEETKEQNQFESLVQGLIDNQYGCCDDFLDAETVSGLRNNLNKLRDSEKMQPAGIGNKSNYQKDDLYRGDRIKWIEKEGEDQYEALFLRKMGGFSTHLNETCYTSLRDFESHYASYEQKSFYKRHLDQFKNDKGRQFSIVLYLNEDWQNEDGGLLSLYPKGEKQKDISPIGGRIVFFRSSEMEHEVHPSFTRDRLSIAGWIKN